MREVFQPGTQRIRNFGKNPSRKTLQDLQPSASDHNLLVPSPSMVRHSTKEAITASKNPFKIPEDSNLLEKENSSVVRRSKRKTVDLGEQSEKGASKEDPAATTSKNLKTKSSKVHLKTKKSSVSVVKKLGKKSTGVNKKNLDSYLSVASSLNEQGESSKNIDACTLDNEDVTISVSKSVSDEINLLTSEVPSETFWKQMAEERRIALESALYENAQLADQVEVLESENGQLKSMLKECENILEILNASLK